MNFWNNDRPVYAGEVDALNKRATVTVTVANHQLYDDGPFYFGETFTDGSLNKVIASLEAIRDSIPPEYRDAARCGIDSESGYEGSHYANIEVTYSRPETDEEWEARKADVHRRLANQTAAKREQLARLKAELGE